MKPYQKNKDFFACGQPVVIRMENGETHVFSPDGEKLSTEDLSFGTVYGGGEGLELQAVSVTHESGLLQGVYGGGIGDTVKNVTLKVTGGAVRSRYVGGGTALKVGSVDITLDNVVAPHVITGSEAVGSVAEGDATVTLNSGVVLNLKCGGVGETKGNITVKVNGGRLEKQILDLGVQGEVNISLPEDIFVVNSKGGQFPMLPETANVTLTPALGYDDIKIYPKNKDEFFNIDAGRLEVRMLELRDPDLKKQDTPFPEFIGDCILVTAPSGENMLIDTGLPYSREELLTSLERLGITRLDYLVLTHFHSDHMGNAVVLMDSLEIGSIVIPDVNIPPEPEMADDFNEIMQRVERGEQTLLPVAEGDELTLGDVRFEVLNPAIRSDSTVTLNDSSVVFKATYAENIMLFTGDIGQAVELRLVGKYGDRLKCDLLKSAHHAITTQNHYKFIDACSPKYTMIHNLREEGVFLKATVYSLINVNKLSPDSLYYTGRDGAVKFSFDGTADGIKISTKYNAKEKKK